MAGRLLRVKLDRFGDYGLIPLLPITFWIALAVLLVSFSVLVRRTATATPLLAAHILTLVAILHATPCLLYGTLRYSWAWKYREMTFPAPRRRGHLIKNWPHGINGFQHQRNAGQGRGLQTSLDYAVWLRRFSTFSSSARF